MRDYIFIYGWFDRICSSYLYFFCFFFVHSFRCFFDCQDHFVDHFVKIIVNHCTSSEKDMAFTKKRCEKKHSACFEYLSKSAWRKNTAQNKNRSQPSMHSDTKHSWVIISSSMESWLHSRVQSLDQSCTFCFLLFSSSKCIAPRSIREIHETETLEISI